MKKIVLLCLLAAAGLGIGSAAADNKPKKESKVVTTVFVTDIDCEHCAKRIMDNVPVLGKGIRDVQVDVPAKRVTVVYDASKNSDEQIIKGLAKIKVKAEPEPKR